MKKAEGIVKELDELGTTLYEKYGTDSYLERCTIHDLKTKIKALNMHVVLKPLTSKDAEFIYSLLPEWSKEAPKGLDPTMYGTNTQEGDQKIVDRVKEILK